MCTCTYFALLQCYVITMISKELVTSTYYMREFRVIYIYNAYAYHHS